MLLLKWIVLSTEVFIIQPTYNYLNVNNWFLSSRNSQSYEKVVDLQVKYLMSNGCYPGKLLAMNN